MNRVVSVVQLFSGSHYLSGGKKSQPRQSVNLNSVSLGSLGPVNGQILPLLAGIKHTLATAREARTKEVHQGVDHSLTPPLGFFSSAGHPERKSGKRCR
jgi:hypothetical protein